MSFDIIALMAHITLHVSDGTYELMKKHPEIKWSEVARKAIVEYLAGLGDRSSGKEVLENISTISRLKLKSVSEEEARIFSKSVVEKEWKRAQSLTQAS